MRQLITTPNQVGELLRGRRRALGVAQQKLAMKLGISQGRLSALEGDAASLTLDRLISLANLLGFELVLQDKSDAGDARGARTKPEW